MAVLESVMSLEGSLAILCGVPMNGLFSHRKILLLNFMSVDLLGELFFYLYLFAFEMRILRLNQLES